MIFLDLLLATKYKEKINFIDHKYLYLLLTINLTL